MSEPTPGYEDGEDVVGHGPPSLTPAEQAELERQRDAGEIEIPSEDEGD